MMIIIRKEGTDNNNGRVQYNTIPSPTSRLGSPCRDTAALLTYDVAVNQSHIIDHRKGLLF